MNEEKFKEVAEKLDVKQNDLESINRRIKFAKVYYPLIQIFILLFSFLLYYFNQRVTFNDYPYYGTMSSVKRGSIFAIYGIITLGNFGFSTRFFSKIRKTFLGILIPFLNALLSGIVFLSISIVPLYSVFRRKNL
ncbi:MAG: hypothetical protein ACXABK_04325 [Candidatus Heimdallarchaeaceae archaeon]|jgi:hypothetical protein